MQKLILLNAVKLQSLKSCKHFFNFILLLHFISKISVNILLEEIKLLNKVDIYKIPMLSFTHCKYFVF